MQNQTLSQKVETVETLKSEGKFYEAGVLAAKLGKNRYYGCHFGMRSTLETARAEFYRGYDAPAVEPEAVEPEAVEPEAVEPDEGFKMTYRVDVQDRNGRAFIERMFNSRPFNQNDANGLAVYGVALSGGKALERNAKQNENWLGLVDSHLLSVSLQTRSNFGVWQDGTSEGGLLCLVDYVHGLAFEGLFIELAQELGETSEEAILVIQCDAKQVYSARLLYAGQNGLAYWESLKTWRGGE